MGDQTKKISFGFSKLAKKTNIVSTHLNKNKQEDDVSKVEFIDCLEGKSIRLKDPVKLDQGPLIIPLTRTKEKSSIQQVNSENEESKDFSKDLKNKPTNESSELVNEENRNSLQTDKLNQNEGQNKLETLDEIAAREILEELNRKEADDDEKRVFSVPLTSNAPSGEKQSTLEDYDNVPVAEFGMAVLRGMGWAPGKGIGKTEKLVSPTLPAPRPKGMGLGADKVIKSFEKKSSNEDLKMVKGSFIRVLAGSEKDAYGQVEGFDDESGRLIIKLALKNVSISLNEFMVQLVDANEFKKNSKVINVSKYEQYKEDEVKKGSSERSQAEEQENIRNRELLSPQSDQFDNKSKVFKKKSRPCEIEEENQKDGRTKVSSDSPESRSARYKGSSSRSSRSPSDRSRIKERSQSKGNKYQSTKCDASSKYDYKRLTSDDKKHISRSSDSSGSSSSYRNKNKSSSTKAKSSVKYRSVSRQRSSSNSSTSDSSGNDSRKKKNKHKKKKSSSNKYRSRSRSRSPRKHKHNKSKTAARH